MYKNVKNEIESYEVKIREKPYTLRDHGGGKKFF